LKLGLVLAFCRCGVAYAFHNVYAYGSFSIEVEGTATAAMAFLSLRERIAV